MMKRRNVLILAVSLILVSIFGSSLVLSNESHSTSINNTVTEHGTKLKLINNDGHNWENMLIEITNATTASGVSNNYYVEAWIEPKSSVTIDLSNMLGYGDTTLPNGTTLDLSTWSGLYNTNPSSDTFRLTLVGWSNTIAPVNASTYNITQGSMSVSTLPSNIITDTVLMGNKPSDIGVEGQGSSILSAQMKLTVNSRGNIMITFPNQPTLYKPMPMST